MKRSFLLVLLLLILLGQGCPTQPPEAVEQPTVASEMVGESMSGYKGTVLAGSVAPVIDFNAEDFQVASASDKLIVLYFYANWCPICKAEVPRMYVAFDELTTDEVIAFRVNYKDSDTDEAEEELAREHGVAYQHTKVFLRNGERVLKAPDSWDTERYLSEITNALGE
jgi:thiol-disulfide isomerase/thioredoxin